MFSLNMFDDEKEKKKKKKKKEKRNKKKKRKKKVKNEVEHAVYIPRAIGGHSRLPAPGIDFFS